MPRLKGDPVKMERKRLCRELNFGILRLCFYYSIHLFSSDIRCVVIKEERTLLLAYHHK